MDVVCTLQFGHANVGSLFFLRMVEGLWLDELNTFNIDAYAPRVHARCLPNSV